MTVANYVLLIFVVAIGEESLVIISIATISVGKALLGWHIVPILIWLDHPLLLEGMQLLVVQVVKYVILRRRLAALDGPCNLLLLMPVGVVRSVSVPRLVTRNMRKVHPISVAIAITK